MRIVIVSAPRDAVGPDLTAGGSVGIVVCNVARELAARHDVTVLAPAGGGPAEERTRSGALVRRLPSKGAKLHDAVDLLTGILPGLPGHTHGAWYGIEYYRQAARALAAAPPDAILLETFAQAAPLLRAACPKALIAVHAHDPRLARLPAATTEPWLAAVDRVVTVSDYLTRLIRAAQPRLGNRVHTVYNGVDPAAFAATEAGDAGPRALFVGRVSPEKGLHVLAQAMNRVVEAVPQASLDVIGQAGLLPYTHVRLFSDDPHWASLAPFYGSGLAEKVRRQVLGPGRDYLQAVQALLTPRAATAVRFLGKVAHAELPPYYRDARLYVQPSLCDEPFGVPLAEAGAAGLPVVASDTGGIPEVIERGVTGLLVPRGDVTALADAMIAILGDPARARAMGEAARRQAAGRFSWAQVARNLEAALAD
ncbi:MAG: glycosyltransferase family 4 protein [Geminicoccaceae bacterium]